MSKSVKEIFEAEYGTEVDEYKKDVSSFKTTQYFSLSKFLQFE
jgi:hypothetical protein